jgi:hypothetical protein
MQEEKYNLRADYRKLKVFASALDVEGHSTSLRVGVK